MTRRFLTLGRRRLSYLDATTGAAGRPRGTLVLIHAFPLNADMWEPQLGEPPEGWRIVAPDLRGFGQSDLGTLPASLDDYAADIIDLLDQIHVDQAVVGGLSMGGYVTFALFRRAAARFAGMMLADTRATADTEEGRAARRKMIELVDREGAAGVAGDMLPKLLSPATHRDRPDVVASVRRLVLASRPEAIKGALASMMVRPDSTALLGSIRCPTLVVVGEDDTLTPIAAARELHEQIAGSTLEIVPAAGHLSNLEQPAGVGAALARFLTNRV